MPNTTLKYNCRTAETVYYEPPTGQECTASKYMCRKKSRHESNTTSAKKQNTLNTGTNMLDAGCAETTQKVAKLKAPSSPPCNRPRITKFAAFRSLRKLETLLREVFSCSLNVLRKIRANQGILAGKHAITMEGSEGMRTGKAIHHQAFRLTMPMLHCYRLVHMYAWGFPGYHLPVRQGRCTPSAGQKRSKGGLLTDRNRLVLVEQLWRGSAPRIMPAPDTLLMCAIT